MKDRTEVSVQNLATPVNITVSGLTTAATGKHYVGSQDIYPLQMWCACGGMRGRISGRLQDVLYSALHRVSLSGRHNDRSHSEIRAVVSSTTDMSEVWLCVSATI